MPRLVLHPLPGSKRAGELTRLLDELWRAGRRVVVWVEDEGRRQILDDFLWTHHKLAFLPHALWSPAMGEALIVRTGASGARQVLGWSPQWTLEQGLIEIRHLLNASSLH